MFALLRVMVGEVGVVVEGEEVVLGKREEVGIDVAGEFLF
jgi:hypothetical protein